VSVKSAIPEYSKEQRKAGTDHIAYMWENYGRFPAYSGPIVTLTAFQAHRLDPKFYEEYYQPGVIP
jgi:hypothetical protein